MVLADRFIARGEAGEERQAPAKNEEKNAAAVNRLYSVRSRNVVEQP